MREPRIPMSPEALPDVDSGFVELPSRPDGFQCEICVGAGEFPSEVTLEKEPGEAQYLVYVEWSWSPMHHRVDAYYLSMSDRFWILWLRSLDDGGDPWRWDWLPYTYCLRNGVGPKTAAIYLLMEAWRWEASRYLDRYHLISELGDLSADEVETIADMVWGSEADSEAEAGQ